MKYSNNVPNLTYGSELWRHSYSYVVEKAQQTCVDTIYGLTRLLIIAWLKKNVEDNLIVLYTLQNQYLIGYNMQYLYIF